jgi:sugar phosphate isomerase/epimerase
VADPADPTAQQPTDAPAGVVPMVRVTPVALSTASCYPESATAAFEMAARLGYDGVEVMVMADAVSQNPNAVERLAEHYDLNVLSIHAPTLLVSQRVWSPDPWEKLRRSREMALILGAPTVVVHPPFRWQRDYAREFVERLPELEHDDVRFAVENMYPWRVAGREVPAYAPHWDPLEQPYPHVTLDLSHAATAGLDGLALLEALGQRMTHLHLTDGSGGPRDEHLVPGRGGQPCAEVCERLADTGFGGTVVIEVSTRGCRTREQRTTLLHEALLFARLHLQPTAPGPAR